MQHKTLEQKKTDFWDLAMQLREYLIRQDIDIDDITCHCFVFSHKDNVYTLSFGRDTN